MSQAPNGTPTFDALVFDAATDGFDRTLAEYRALYRAGADVEPLRDDFRATVRAVTGPGEVVFDRRLRGLAHARDAGRVRRDGFDHFTLQLMVEGEAILRAAETEHRLRPGDYLVMDMTQPMQSHVSGRLITASLSRERLIQAGLPPAKLPTAVQRDRDGSLAPALLAVGQAGAADPLEIVARQLHDQPLSPRPDRRRLNLERLERVRAFVDAQRSEEELTPESIARATGMSRATLYRTMEPLGGVSEWVRRRRLAWVRLQLAQGDRPLLELAQEAGLRSLSNLSSAFRDRYGQRPTAFRRDQRDGEAAPSGAAAARRALHDMPVALALASGVRRAA